jgi:hypothetical protein
MSGVPFEVEAAFSLARDAPDPKVGEPFKLIVTARHEPGSIALLPSPLELGGAVAEREAARVHTRSTEGGVQIDRYELELLAFERGIVTIPPIPLAVGSTTAETAALEITIASGFEGEELAAVTSTQPEAMGVLENLTAKDPPAQQVMVPDYTLFWVVGSILVVGLGLWIARVVSRRREAAKPPPPPPPPRPAHEIALERLAEIRSADHLSTGAHKVFYTELSSTMRAYAGDRWSFDSLDLTVDELVDVLREKKTDGLDLTKMTHLLQLSDQVKFAKFVPTKADGDALLDDAVALVEATK